jgi:uncharacterized membrane protein
MQTFSKVYDSYAQAERAVSDLENAGVPNADISLVANKHVSEEYADVDDVSSTASGAGIGAALGGGAGLLAWLASTAVGAIAGSAAGGILGALVSSGTSEEDAHVYSEAVRRGGTLVTVRTTEAINKVDGILNRHQPIDPAHRRGEYEQAGWKQFDPKAPAYKPDQAEIDRMRRPYD